MTNVFPATRSQFLDVHSTKINQSPPVFPHSGHSPQPSQQQQGRFLGASNGHVKSPGHSEAATSSFYRPMGFYGAHSSTNERRFSSSSCNNSDNSMLDNDDDTNDDNYDAGLKKRDGVKEGSDCSAELDSWTKTKTNKADKQSRETKLAKRLQNIAYNSCT